MKRIETLFLLIVLTFFIVPSISIAQTPSAGLIPSEVTIIIPTGSVTLPPGLTIIPSNITPTINVRSGEPLDIPPTPTPEPSCGDAYGEGIERNCCNKNWDSVTAETNSFAEGVESECREFLGISLCLKSALDTGVTAVKGLIGLNDEDLGLMTRCATGVPVISESKCICEPEDKGATLSASMCDRYLSTSKDHESCFDCFTNKKGYWSGIGCIYMSNFTDFIEKNVFGTLLGFAGVFAFMCILYASILMQTSRGDTEKIKRAQQLLTSCVTGLILIIFSVFILRIVGVNILGIPGFQ